MKALLLAIALLAGASAGAAAQSAAPWVDDQALLQKAQDDIVKGGILALSTHADAIETALANEKHSIELARTSRPTSFVLTDGLAETLVSIVLAKDTEKDAAKIAAVPNPCPLLSFYLASYYDENQRPADALRVLDAELAVSAGPNALGVNGDNWPAQIVERGAALMPLRRWDEVLANEDNGLKAEKLEDPKTLRPTLEAGAADRYLF